MKKFTSLLICLSLTLIGAAFAQQPEGESTPGKKQGAEKTHQAEPKTPKTQGENAAKPEATAKQPGAMKEPGATTETGAEKGRKGRAKTETTTGAETNVSGEPTATMPPGGKHQAGRQKGMAGTGANAKASPSMTPATAPSASAAPAVAASASAAPAVAATAQQNTAVNATGGMRKADPQKVQQVKQQVSQIKQQHASFRAQPRPDKVPAVTFNQNFRIEGSDRWQGSQYEVFRSYHPQRHDRNWYHSRYSRVELIGGGYYYWNNGYWYPAWGYEPSAEYYAYDAPIYVGHSAEPPDRVIADVQAELQEMGYYEGEVDGLLGPLTREALAAYQADQGLTPTAMIDEPTLDSLQLS